MKPLNEVKKHRKEEVRVFATQQWSLLNILRMAAFLGSCDRAWNCAEAAEHELAAFSGGHQQSVQKQTITTATAALVPGQFAWQPSTLPLSQAAAADGPPRGRVVARRCQPEQSRRLGSSWMMSQHNRRKQPSHGDRAPRIQHHALPCTSDEPMP